MTTQLGLIIRQRRIALGLTQEQLAERVSGTDYVTQTDISRIEIGRVKLPHYERLERLAAELNLSLGDLLARSGWSGAEAAMANPAGPLLDRLPDACYTVDRDWRYTYINQRAADLAGHAAQELLGQPVWEQCREACDDPVFVAAQHAMREQVGLRIERYDPSSETWFETDLHPSPDGLTVLARAVTALTRAEINMDDGLTEELPDHATNHHARYATMQRYAGVSHELRCLVTMVVGSIQLFRRHLDAGNAGDSQEFMHCLDEIETTAQIVSDRLHDLIQTDANQIDRAAVPRDARHHAIQGRHEFLHWRRNRHAAGDLKVGRPPT